MLIFLLVGLIHRRVVAARLARWLPLSSWLKHEEENQLGIRWRV